VPVLGITGGIATGKSSFTRCLTPFLGASSFDADATARDLLANDPQVLNQVRQRFGEEFVAENGVDRARLRERVFESDADRKQLEAILHPMIRERWLAEARSARESKKWLLIDIPLLFENRLESAFDAVVVVACRASTQRARIVSERGLSAEMAERIIAAQENLASKIARAAHVVWSDAPEARLGEQAQLLAEYLQKRFCETL